MPEMEIRHFEARADVEERTIIGLAVPYGEEADLGGGVRERFEAGAIESVEDVKLFYGHEDPIGKVLEGKDTEAGFEIRAKVSETPKGDEVLTLMRDGVLNKFSVGFFPVESERDGSVIIRKKVDLREVSVVAIPAFAGANITEVRSEQVQPELEAESHEQERKSMSENMELEVRSVQDEVAELRRVVEAGLTPATPAVVGAEIRSQGELAKALIKGDEDAKALVRTASTSADAAIIPPFVGYLETLINNNRPTLSAFQRGALPASGLAVEYVQIDSNTLAVDEQASENTALEFGNLSFEVKSVDVKTYGGYTSFSRQYVERATIDTLNQVFQGLTIAYANATNKVVVDLIEGLSYTGKTFTANTDASTVAKAIAEGSAYIFEKTGLRPEFIICPVDAYVNLVSIGATDGRLNFATTGENMNMVGNANIPGLSGTLFGLPLIVDPQRSGDDAIMGNSAALTSWESAGAPVRLTAGDITTLQDDVSVYGYMAVAVQRPDALVLLNTTAA
jgi:HK97 family phage prohead protease